MRVAPKVLLMIPTAVAVILCSLNACQRVFPSAPSLDLEEIGAFPLPDSFPVTRATVSTQGNIVLFAKSQKHLLFGRNGVFGEFGAGFLQTPIAVAFDSIGTIHEVVDAELRSIIQFRSGEVLSTSDLPVHIRATDAVHIPGVGWYLAGIDSIGRAVIVAPISAEQPGEIPLSGLTTDLDDEVLLTALPSGALIATRPRHPETWAFVEPGENPKYRQPLDLAASSFRSERTTLLDPLWVGLELLPVDEYLLYTLSDLRSTERRFALFTSEGKFVRQTKVAAPMGLVSTVPGSPQLTAIRSINGSEVVTYRWRWGTGSESL